MKRRNRLILSLIIKHEIAACAADLSLQAPTSPRIPSKRSMLMISETSGCLNPQHRGVRAVASLNRPRLPLPLFSHHYRLLKCSSSGCHSSFLLCIFPSIGPIVLQSLLVPTIWPFPRYSTVLIWVHLPPPTRYFPLLRPNRWAKKSPPSFSSILFFPK